MFVGLLVALLASGCGLLLDTAPARTDRGNPDGSFDGSFDARADARFDASSPDAIIAPRDATALDADPTRPWQPAFRLEPGPDTCPEGFAFAEWAGGCTDVNGASPGWQISIFVDPPVTPWQEVRGRVRGLQGQTPDAFIRDATSLDAVYVDGVSITTEAPRQHIWTFAAGLMKPDRGPSGNSCPCDNGYPAPAMLGDAWTCETGNDANSYENRLIYTEDILWDADGDAHGAGCLRVTDPGEFHVRLAEPTTARIEIRLMADDSDDNVAIIQLDLDVR